MVWHCMLMTWPGRKNKCGPRMPLKQPISLPFYKRVAPVEISTSTLLASLTVKRFHNTIDEQSFAFFNLFGLKLVFQTDNQLKKQKFKKKLTQPIALRDILFIFNTSKKLYIIFYHNQTNYLNKF